MMVWDEASHGLGVAEMDTVHEEFMGLLATAITADDAELPAACARLGEHVIDHFANESRLMRAYRFGATAEHESDHARILGDLARMERSLERGRRAIVREYLSAGLSVWFGTHLQTMDAALAARLRDVKQAA